MRLKAFVPFLFIAFIACVTVPAHAQEQDGDEPAVRGAFLTSRPTTSGSQSSSATHKTSSTRKTTPPPQTVSKKTTPKSTGKGASTAKETGGTNNGMGNGTSKSLTSSGSGTGDAGTGGNAQPSGNSYGNTSPATALALGYTLYMRDASGDAVRVDPSREFHNGDRVRIALEPNTDSYLYVFHTENNSQPEMIFPDQRLSGGDNFIEAHVPTEIPSSQEQNESLRWFTFYGQPATERLYIVITREPLPLVPTGDTLVTYCQVNKASCPWHPSGQIWAQVQKELNARVLVNKEKNYGQAQTTREREATTRGFGLDQSAPSPSVIRMNATSNAPVLVTALDLVHQ
ncbi:MAG TPA: DUF4384 domain-containing protein [Pyrinomonadaceae bacterium]|jgi:hypothetical protein|nr:DUF4384 domain-containing protein [Pyrinomonadaceae bacterium]